MVSETARGHAIVGLTMQKYGTDDIEGEAHAANDQHEVRMLHL